MHCEDAARNLYDGKSHPDLELHLSACEDCRLLSEDLSRLSDAFAQARRTWVPSPAFHVRLPLAPWRRLAIAASLLVIPLAGWAVASLREAPRSSYDVMTLLEPSTAPVPSDRELLGTLFLEETRP
jgi:hypothetical protein